MRVKCKQNTLYLQSSRERKEAGGINNGGGMREACKLQTKEIPGSLDLSLSG